MKNRILFAATTFFLSACGAGSGEGLDENGQPQTQNSVEEGTQTPDVDPPNQNSGVSLEELVSQIFNNNSLGGQRCTNCHSGGSPLGGLNLESAALAYANLVGANGEGVAANGNASFKRVDPGNPDESFLILKLEGDARAGSQMPLGQTPLTADQINSVRDWIANGAAESGGGNNATRITKVSEISNGWDLHLHFSRPLADANNTENVLQVYTIEAGEHFLLDTDTYIVQVNSQDLYLHLNDAVFNTEGYRVVVNDPTLSAVYDVNGRLIDGDNNTQDGGAYRYEYLF